MRWDVSVRLRPEKSVHMNCEVIFEVKQFKRSSQSHLTWLTPSLSVGKGWFLSTLDTPAVLCAEGLFQHAFCQQLPGTGKSEIHQQNQEAAIFLAPLVLGT